MKKLLLCAIVATFGIFLVTASGSASTFTLPQSVLLDTTNFVDLDGPSLYYTTNTGTLHSRNSQGIGARYEITLDATSGWSDIQIGDGFDHPSDNSGMVVGGGSLGGDLTGYTAYKLVISNPNPTAPWFRANIYLNTGWTDQSEFDNFYENGWVWIAPGTSQEFSIDLTAVLNLNHVSNIGFKVGANVTGDDEWNSFDWNKKFNVDVNPVPIPPSALLLGFGLLGLIGVGRFRFGKQE